MPRYSFERTEILSQEEVGTMLKNAQLPWVKTIISILYLFGCRLIEALWLRRQDVWEDEEYVYARFTLAKRRAKGPFPHVTHQLRISKDSPFIEEMMGHIRSIQDPNEFVFSIGRTWGTARVVAWREIKKLNANCSPHIFRHSRLTKLALRDASPLDLQDWAGWGDARPAKAYLHVSGKLAEKYSDKID